MIGGGVVGVSTAWFLAEAGFDVTVIEADDLASGASSGNAGIVTPGDSIVWASPDALRPMVTAMLGRDESVTIARSSYAGLPRYGLRFLRYCTSKAYTRGLRSAYALSSYSRTLTEGLIESLALDVYCETRGSMLLFDSSEALAAGISARAPLAAAGNAYRTLGIAEILEHEPTLAQGKQAFAGALLSTGDISADSAQFTRQLAEHARTVGVNVKTGSEVSRITSTGAGVQVVTRDDEAAPVTFDQAVVCAGAWSGPLLASVGVRAVIQPVRGFTATVPLADPAHGPSAAGVDEGRHVAFSRMGDAMRFSCGARYVGRLQSPRHVVRDQLGPRLDYMAEVAHDLFGEGCFDFSRATVSARERPVTPRGLPLVGPSRVPGVWVNSGHGPLGWTQAAGSGRLLTDLMSGRSPQIDPRPYALPG